MLSRVANTIYWMNRYIERAENYARFMDVNFNLALDLSAGITEQWKPLVISTGDGDLFDSLYAKADKSNVIHFLGFDSKNPNSIYNCIVNARENARAIRPEITKEVWEQINYLYYFVKEGSEKKLWKKKDPRDFFLEVKKGCQLLCGIFETTISRTDGWHFGKIGLMIERADKTSRVLDVKYHTLLPTASAIGSPIDLIHWTALLKSVSAYDMYRKKYGKLTSVGITEFLILDKTFPRSILRCIMNAETSLHAITGKVDSYSNEAEKELGKLRSQLEFDDINEIIAGGLHEFLNNIQIKLNDVSDAVFENFFSIENS